MDRKFGLFGLFNKSVDLFGSAMNSEKLIIDKESQNKTNSREGLSQPAFTCSKLTIETLEQGVKYVQS